MLHYSLIFLVGIGLGWLVHYNIYTPKIITKVLYKDAPACIESEKEEIAFIVMPLSKEKETIIETTPKNFSEKVTLKGKKPKKERLQSLESKFSQLLKENLFSDAMSLYMDAKDEILGNLQAILMVYFERVSISTPLVAIEQMLEFHSMVSEGDKILLMLVELYKKRKSYSEAVELLSEMIQANDLESTTILIANLLSTSKAYLKELKDAQTFNSIISFLDERIMYGIESEFFTLLLAQHYMEQHEYFKAQEVLLSIEYEEKYKIKTAELLAVVKKKIELKEAYIYKIPLERRGKHFIVSVFMDNIPLRLMLDTGASTTSVRQDKLTSLTIVKENVKFRTAGGVVFNHMYKANIFRMGEIELRDFKISGLSYYDEDSDGLLGMNFLRKFDFKIDQHDNILYLTKTE